MRRKVALGADLGSTAVKVCAFALGGAAPEPLCSASRAFATDSRAGGIAEQDPEAWVAALGAALEEVLAGLDPARDGVELVALSGQMQAVVAVRDGAALRPAMLYSDTRAGAEAAALEAAFEGGAATIAAATGNYKGAASCLAKLSWLKGHETEALAASEHVLFGAHGFACLRLTGEALCDVTTADTTGLLCHDQEAWAKDFVCRAGLEGVVAKLPRLVHGSERTATLSSAAFSRAAGLSEAAERCLADSVEVFHGCGDLGSTSIGAAMATGSLESPYLYLGTSGWIAQGVPKSREHPVRPPGVFRVHHALPGWELWAVPTTTCGGSVDWFRCMLSQPSASELDALAAEAPAGANGVLFLPHLAGERAPLDDPAARGAFVGLQAHTTRHDMARAVLEGVAFHFRWLRDTLGAAPSGPVAIVGGGARSSVWRGILADVLGSQVRSGSREADVAALGAVCLATGQASQAHPAATEHGATSDPRGGQIAVRYDALFGLWRLFYEALREPFRALNAEQLAHQQR